MMDAKSTLLTTVTNHIFLAQAEGAEAASGLPVGILVAVFLLLVLIAIIVLARRGAPQTKERLPKAERPDSDVIPTVDLLEDREEVEEPIEIHDGMSLAEIRAAKRARVVGKKARRETAAEATERSIAEQAALEAEPEVKEPEVEVEEAPEVKEPEVEVEEEPEVEAAEELELEEPEVEVEEGPEVEEEPQGLDKEPSITLPRPTLREPSERSEAPTVRLPRPKGLPRPGVKKEEEAPAEEAEVEVPTPVEEPEPAVAEEAEPAKEVVREEEKSLAEGLEKTRTGFIDRLGSLFRGAKLDDDMVEEIEEILFTADIGTKIAQEILDKVEEQLSSEEKQDPAAVWSFIRSYSEDILRKHEETIDFEAGHPFVMLVIGVNGVGKTTTIGKIASQLTRQGKKVLLVAGDTFRAGAVDQLEVWAKRTGLPMHRGEDKADPSSVIYGGIKQGIEDGVDVIICDTAGRLHTQSNLLDELKKMARVAGNALDGAPHETVLVLDANTGQNAIAQAKLFGEALDITGVILTKLDGTAKGGVILGICDELQAPVRYIGIGEGIRDLRPFDSEEFVEALFI